MIDTLYRKMEEIFHAYTQWEVSLMGEFKIVIWMGE